MSNRLSHSPIWFQLANVRLTNLQLTLANPVSFGWQAVRRLSVARKREGRRLEWHATPR